MLRAWLIRDGKLLDAVPLGPRGGGLKRIARILESSSSLAPGTPLLAGAAGRRRADRALAG